MTNFFINEIKLDEDQIAIIKNESKRLLVIAPAGAGKTLTIIGKIRYLIEEKGILSNKILCISFTNEATNSLKKKLKDYYNYNIDVKTFHKVAMSILKNQQLNIASDELLEETVDFFLENLIYEYPYLIKCVLRYFKACYLSWNYIKKYEDLKTNNKILKLKKTILTFLKLFKTNGYKISDFHNFLKVRKYFNFLSITYVIYHYYQSELEATSKVDLDDLILKATEEVSSSDINYDYIIVDEYQDTSMLRFQLLNNILIKTNAKLMCVGDDFQSIYNFSGCTLNLFINFSKYFPDSQLMFIKHTYRNVQELIDVAGDFIMQNKYQIEKELISFKRESKPFILIYYKNVKQDFTKIVLELSKKGNLLILGRNNFDINKYLDLNIFKIDNKGNIYYQNSIIARFLSVHKSKGLESDNVILINLENDIYGFPNMILDERVLNLVKNTDLTIPFAEERRLFYVALTRSKNKVYFYLSNNEAIFVKELKRHYKQYLQIKKLKN